MEGPEESYRNLCSSETLRSGKQGFFCEFADRVATFAGEQWISKVFGRVVDDRARMRTAFADDKIKGMVLETLGRVQCLYRPKDAGASRARRLEGLAAETAGHRDKALLLLSQAVLRAPATGRCEAVDRGLSLPLALLARAELLTGSDEYALAFEDLSTIEEAQLPDSLKLELARKRETCEKYLRANEKSLIPSEQLCRQRNGGKAWKDKDLPRPSGGENQLLPAASALIEIEETALAGKRVIAASEISPGDTLVVEPPLAAALLPEFFGTHCQHCFSRLRCPIGCSECSTVAFCSRKCRDEATSSYHKYECKVLALLIGSGMSILSMLALRMVTQNGLSNCLEICRALDQRALAGDSEDAASPPDGTATNAAAKLSKSAKRRIRKKKLRDAQHRGQGAVGAGNPCDIDLRAYDLVSHEKQRSSKDFLERTLMAAFLLKCLKAAGFFEKSTKAQEAASEEEIAVGSLLLKHLQLLQFNAHEVFETRQSAEHRFRGSRPVYIGVAIYPTVARFNHDCYPAVTRYFIGRAIVIRAIRSLRAGDAVAENYGPIFTKRSLEERQRSLAGRYWFRCTCTACKENWPTFDRMTNDAVRLRCPTTGCERLHRQPGNPAQPGKCQACNRNVDLRGRIAGLRECEELYERGFATMDQERPEAALRVFLEASRKFHAIAWPPHKDTHLAEIAAAACMADQGNTWSPPMATL